jgi:hypothetical protein
MGREHDKREMEKLNKRIRRTILSMRNEDLIHVVQSSDYTPYALQVARQELARRGGKRAVMRKVTGAPISEDLVNIEAPGQDEATATPQVDFSTISRPTECYIEVWRDKNFEGDSLRIEGPSEVADLCSNDSGWCGQISSIRIGPQAFVVAYDEKKFKGKALRLGPGEEVADLGSVKFDDEIDSIKIVDSIRVFDCTNSSSHRKRRRRDHSAATEPPQGQNDADH